MSLAWLTAVTDWLFFQWQSLLFAALLATLVVLTRQQWLPVSDSLAAVLQWALLLIFGPSVIWLFWLATLITAARLWRQEQAALRPSDILVAYSDGVSEVQDGRQEE